MKTIEYIEFLKKINDENKSVLVYDLREEGSTNYGMLPKAKWYPKEKMIADLEGGNLPFSKEDEVILYCVRGTASGEMVERLEEAGYENVCHYATGYNGYLMDMMAAEEEKAQNQATNEEGEEEESRQHQIEVSIRKKFHKNLLSRFAKACKEYELIQDGDKIAVCISGGKDSMLMAKLFQELQRHKKMDFSLEFLVMDPGYNEANRRLIESNAKMMGIPIKIFESTIFDAVDTVEKNPCYLCARMRRGHLYHQAKQLGCNKIALGHHYDDVIETILMGMLHGGQIQTMMPKLHSTNFEGMELIRPLYLIREEDIKHWRDYNNLYFLQCACHFTETCSTCHEDGTTASKRLETKKLIAELVKKDPFIESNIFRSVENVNLSTVITYKDKSGVRHNFLEDYDQ